MFCSTMAVAVTSSAVGSSFASGGKFVLLEDDGWKGPRYYYLPRPLTEDECKILDSKRPKFSEINALETLWRVRNYDIEWGGPATADGAYFAKSIDYACMCENVGKCTGKKTGCYNHMKNRRCVCVSEVECCRCYGLYNHKGKVPACEYCNIKEHEIPESLPSILPQKSPTMTMTIPKKKEKKSLKEKKSIKKKKNPKDAALGVRQTRAAAKNALRQK